MPYKLPGFYVGVRKISPIIMGEILCGDAQNLTYIKERYYCVGVHLFIMEKILHGGTEICIGCES